MENLLEQFWNDLRCQIGYLVGFGKHCPKFKADDSEFVFVDGEKGDYGKITYRDHNDQVIAVSTISGGSVDDTEFTQYGRAVMTGIMLTIFKEALFPAKDEEKHEPTPGNEFADIFEDFLQKKD